jgi:hypothetical protein
MLPGESSKQDRDAIPLLSLEGPLYGPVKMGWLVQAGNLPQLTALRFQTLFDFFVVIDLYEMGCHYLPPAQCAGHLRCR